MPFMCYADALSNDPHPTEPSLCTKPKREFLARRSTTPKTSWVIIIPYYERDSFNAVIMGPHGGWVQNHCLFANWFPFACK